MACRQYVMACAGWRTPARAAAPPKDVKPSPRQRPWSVERGGSVWDTALVQARVVQVRQHRAYTDGVPEVTAGVESHSG